MEANWRLKTQVGGTAALMRKKKEKKRSTSSHKKRKNPGSCSNAQGVGHGPAVGWVVRDRRNKYSRGGVVPVVGKKNKGP